MVSLKGSGQIFKPGGHAPRSAWPGEAALKPLRAHKKDECQVTRLYFKGVYAVNVFRNRLVFLPLALSALAVPPGRALAQQPAVLQLREIVVTAQRVRQNVLAVPAAVQAMTGQELRDKGIQKLTDLQFDVPGYLPTTGSGYTQIFIRGIGNSIFVGADPSVATYIDGVPRIYGSMVDQLIDVKRIEVLKGAQGGLYGRNATGGVVNIITRQPEVDKFKGNALFDYASFNTIRVAAYLNLPINDKMAFNMSVERESHDPYIRNVSRNPAPYTAAMFPGGSALGTAQQTAATLDSVLHPPRGDNSIGLTAADAKLLIKPVDNFRVTLAGDYTLQTGNSGGQLYSGVPAFNQILLTGILGAFGANAQLPPGFLQKPGESFTESVGEPTFVHLIDYGESATMVWDLPTVALTSISAYRYQQTFFYTELGGDTVPIISVAVHNFKHFFYQELRAVSRGSGPFHYLGGATFLRDIFTGNTTTYTLALAPNPGAAHVVTSVHDWSVYAQLGYDFTRQLNLTVSGRYLRETNDTKFAQPVVAGASTVETAFTPSATLSYKLGAGNVYARWARGFKAGGVNPVASPTAFPLSSEGSVFGPEHVDTYEIGYRNTLWHDRAHFTTDIFYNNYTNLQVSAHAQPAYESQIVLAIVNAGKARTYGWEETFDALVARGLTLGVNAGYLNAKYLQFAIQNNPVLANFNLDNTTMTNSPKWQLGLTANLDEPITDRLDLVGNLLESYTSSLVFGPAAGQPFGPGTPTLPEPGTPAYWITNLRVGLQTSDGKYGVAVYANNLFNRAYFTQGTSTGVGNQYIWGDPRVIGGEITASF